MNDNEQSCGSAMIRRQLYAVANWFYGTLCGTVQSDQDTAMRDAMKRWLDYQSVQYKASKRSTHEGEYDRERITTDD